MRPDRPAIPTDSAAIEAALDLRIAEMRQMLIEMRSADTTAALRSLRESFPDVPFAERVRALAATRH